SGSVYIYIIYVEYEQATIEPTYSITGLSNITNGSVTANATSNITAGTNITLTISPDTGYELETLTVDGNDVTSSVSNNEYSFSMPSHDVAVSATFTASGVGGSGTMTFVTTSQSGGVISGTLTGNPEGVTVSCTGNVNAYQSGRGIQLTQSKNTLTFTASGFTSDYKLTGININYCSNASSGSGVANATLGQTSVASELSLNSTGGSTLRNAPMTVTETIFNGDDLIITITASANSIYINEIDVDYVENVGPSLTVVEGIAAFKQVDPGTTVRLYLPDANNARVTHVESNSGGTVDAYVRDNTGAIRFTGISPNRPMAYNQHLAGWINGQYSVGSDGIPQFVPDEGLTNTAFLVIADPVTENDTEAKAITTSEIGNNLGDWVTITDVDVADVTVNNVFNLNYPTNSEHLYAGATIDINAIAALGQLYPVDDKDQYPITFVVNSAQNYTAPNTNITNVKVRLKRNLAAEKWTGLIVPFGFELTDFDGKVMELSSVTKGDDVWGEISERWFEAVNMNFVEADEIVAGKPYLIKPDENVSELTFTGVTLSSQDVVTETLHLTGPLS
ncbi:MAG: hypothetical protein IK092_03900, partial [Muribaculaceae bacterium]|nr:hypothetical protein [Muribaculaceae bacterium]